MTALSTGEPRQDERAEIRDPMPAPMLARLEAGRDQPVRPVEPLSKTMVVLAAVLLGAVGLGSGLLFGIGDPFLDRETVMIVAGVVGLIVAVATATRYWFVVVAMFVLRASLDALKLENNQAKGVIVDPTAATNAFDPGVIIALVMLASGVGWLITQKRSGRLHPMSGPTKWFLGLAGAGSLSALSSGALAASFGVSLKIWAGAIMMAVLEQAYRQKPARIKAILGAGAASLIIPAFVGIQQLLGPQELAAYLQVSRIRGTFVHPNPFATYLVIVAVVALAVRPHLRRGQRLAADAVFALASVLTLFTYARGAWVALLLGIIVVGAFQDKRLIVIMIGAVLAALFLVPSVSARLSDLGNTEQIVNGNPNSLAWRISYWERLMPLAAENPVTGIGLDRVLVRTPEKLMPHNTVVQALVETGVVGLGALLGLVCSTAIALRDVIRRTPPGLARGVAVGAAAAGLGWVTQLGSENLLTQAAIFWYLAGPTAFALALRAERFDVQGQAAGPPEASTLAPAPTLAP